MNSAIEFQLILLIFLVFMCLWRRFTAWVCFELETRAEIKEFQKRIDAYVEILND